MTANWPLAATGKDNHQYSTFEIACISGITGHFEFVASSLGDLEAGPHGELNAGNMRVKCGSIVNIYG